MTEDRRTDLQAAGERTISIGGDIALIEGLRKDEQASLAKLYQDYGGIAYGLAVNLLGATAEAEDVVQESFLALWRQADRLDPSRGVRSYLLTIVHNKSIDRLRGRKRRNETAIDSAMDFASGQNLEADAEKASERETVRQALVGLPQEQRLTIEMAYFKGLTLNEVAQRMSVPTGTVKSRMRLALSRLRGLLAVQS